MGERVRAERHDGGIAVSELEQRVAYLHGLASGFNLREASKEGEVLMEVLDVLDLMASSIARVESEHEDLEEYVESLDEDLTELEEDYYELEEGEVVEVECPACGASIELEGDEEEEGQALDLTCPECGVALTGGAGEEHGRRRQGDGDDVLRDDRPQ